MMHIPFTPGLRNRRIGFNRFDFSGGKGVVRPNKNHIASTTLEIMRGQGMKYVHAITDGRQGVEGDLEKSKRQIKRYKETVSACGSHRLYFLRRVYACGGTGA